LDTRFLVATLDCRLGDLYSHDLATMTTAILNIPEGYRVVFWILFFITCALLSFIWYKSLPETNEKRGRKHWRQWIILLTKTALMHTYTCL